jgi:hypothetical protein
MLVSALLSELLFKYPFFHVLLHPWGHPICYWRVDFVLWGILVLIFICVLALLLLVRQLLTDI